MRNRKKNSANVTFNRKLTGTDNEGEEEIEISVFEFVPVLRNTRSRNKN